MGLHHCQHPCWHRALILFGTIAYFYGVGLTLVWTTWVPQAWRGYVFGGYLVSVWLFKHLLQWHCQGQEPCDGRRMAAVALMLGSVALLSHDDD